MKKTSSHHIIISFIFLFFFLGCGQDDSVTLSPARKISGTWKTTLPVKFFIKTDFCTAQPVDVATQSRMVTMEIKETGEYTVSITITYSGSDFTPVDADCNPTGYVPDVSPMFYSGNIASNQLSVLDSDHYIKGIFTFTSDLMEGTWNDLWCMGFCQDVYTEQNALKLSLQH